MQKIIFSKPYVFEGESFTEIDLSPVEDMTTRQLANVERRFERAGAFSALKEMNLEYCLMVAAEATGKPVEFFQNLPAREGTRVKQAVTKFFFGEE